MTSTKEYINALPIGTIVKGISYSYTILKVLGQGTFGITYLASVKMTGTLGSLDTEILVAIKEFFMKKVNGRDEFTVTSSSKEGSFAYYKSRFIKEAENLSKLKHPGIIKVVELFEGNGTAYYSMGYVEGGSLDNRIAKFNGLSEAECINYACQIGKALDYMHSQNMLHLDLKPNNIMLHNGGQIVLIDFGLSKQFGSDGMPETSTTIGHGTPGYAPIEQACYQGEQKDGFPATLDIYAFGATMFKMLTGLTPPAASIVLNEGFPASELKALNISEGLIKIIRTCMEPLCKNRYKTMSVIIDALMSLSLSNEDEKTTLDDTGYYKKGSGSKEYGNYKVDFIPVSSSFKFPQSIKIRLWDNSKKGKSYEIYLTDVFPLDGDISLQNSIKIWDKGAIVYEDGWHSGVPSDIKEYVVKHGLLSTVHWENEDITTPCYDNFGYDVSIEMYDDEGNIFIRRVKHAHKEYHTFLLEAVEDLLASPSIAEFVNGYGIKENKKKQRIYNMSDDITRELIYSIPDSTAEIHISYTSGGSVGLEKTCSFSIGRTAEQLSPSPSEHIINEKEFTYLVEGLRRLKLKSKDRQLLEPSTGITFPTLLVTLYDNSGKLIKAFYAQEKDGQRIGDIDITVEELKEELAKISPTFNGLLKTDQSDKSNSSRTSSSDVVFRLVIFTIIIGIISLPTYFFVSATDKFYYWLWSSIGVAELFSAILFSIGGRFNKTKDLSNFETITFIIGILGLITYIVLWVCQMCNWWL